MKGPGSIRRVVTMAGGIPFELLAGVAVRRNQPGFVLCLTDFLWPASTPAFFQRICGPLVFGRFIMVFSRLDNYPVSKAHARGPWNLLWIMVW